MSLADWLKLAPLLAAIAISASMLISLVAFIHTRRVNRRQATLDLIVRTFLDDKGRQQYSEFKSIVRRDQDPKDSFNLINLLDWNERYETEFNSILLRLNDYELVALGIRRGLFDEQFYKLWFWRQLITDYEQLKELIDALQERSPAHFNEFSALYRRWLKRGRPVSGPNRFRLIWWAITKNYEKLDRARFRY